MIGRLLIKTMAFGKNCIFGRQIGSPSRPSSGKNMKLEKNHNNNFTLYKIISGLQFKLIEEKQDIESQCL